jgi:hypothetical protein
MHVSCARHPATACHRCCCCLLLLCCCCCLPAAFLCCAASARCTLAALLPHRAAPKTAPTFNGAGSGSAKPRAAPPAPPAEGSQARRSSPGEGSARLPRGHWLQMQTSASQRKSRACHQPAGPEAWCWVVCSHRSRPPLHRSAGLPPRAPPRQLTCRGRRPASSGSCRCNAALLLLLLLLLERGSYGVSADGARGGGSPSLSCSAGLPLHLAPRTTPPGQRHLLAGNRPC